MPITGVSADQQISGVYDDGSGSGILHARIMRSHLVPHAFLPGHYSVGSGTGATGIQLNANNPGNSDGTSTGILLNPGTGLDTSGQWINFTFTGPALGIRVRIDDSTANTQFITVMVDGISYEIPTVDYAIAAGASSGFPTPAGYGQPYSSEWRYILPDDFGEGLHHARIVAVGDTTSRSITVYGYLAVAEAGYVPPQKLGTILDAGANLTNTALTVIGGALGGGALIFDTAQALNKSFGSHNGIRKIIYTNTTAGPVVVSIGGYTTPITSAPPTSGGVGYLVWSASVPANSSVTFDLGTPVPLGEQPYQWRHAADTANAINWTLVGGL